MLQNTFKRGSFKTVSISKNYLLNLEEDGLYNDPYNSHWNVAMNWAAWHLYAPCVSDARERSMKAHKSVSFSEVSSANCSDPFASLFFSFWQSVENVFSPSVFVQSIAQQLSNIRCDFILSVCFCRPKFSSWMPPLNKLVFLALGGYNRTDFCFLLRRANVVQRLSWQIRWHSVMCVINVYLFRCISFVLAKCCQCYLRDLNCIAVLSTFTINYILIYVAVIFYSEASFPWHREGQ